VGGAHESRRKAEIGKGKSMPLDLRAIAEAKFKKRELQRLDGCAAMAEYQGAGPLPSKRRLA